MRKRSYPEVASTGPEPQPVSAQNTAWQVVRTLFSYGDVHFAPDTSPSANGIRIADQKKRQTQIHSVGPNAEQPESGMPTAKWPASEEPDSEGPNSRRA